ncbi:MAG: ABC transporter ATP-binding protein, partial [Proteobacteria bacterium]
RFFSYYAPYKVLFLLDFGCAIVAGLLELGFPLAVKLFVDELLPSQNWGLIAGVAALLLGVYAVNTGLMAIVNYWGHALGIGIETDMRRQAFDHIQKLSFRYFDNNKTGQLITHVTKDLEEVGEVAHHGPEDVFIAIMTFIGAFILMFTVNWKLALMTTAIVPFMTWLVSRYGARMTENWRRLFRQVGDFNTRVTESVGGIRVVKAFANEDHERSLFAVNNEGYRATKLNAYAYMTASVTLSYFSTRFVQLIVMVAGTWFVIAGELSYGGFVGFLLLVNVFFRPIDKITSVLESYPKGIAGFRRFTNLIDTEPDIADRPGALSVEALKGDIVFDDVSFGYGEQGKVLDGLSLSIAAGETVALVGESGAGKTTICSLLPRFYEVDSGAISI